MVLTDGGVYDNMGEQWARGFASRVKRCSEPWTRSHSAESARGRQRVGAVSMDSFSSPAHAAGRRVGGASTR